MRNTFMNCLIDEAQKNEKIVFITADLGYGVVEKFQEYFPDRFFNLGITEQSTISFAAGLAQSGFKPFVYSIANFPTFRCIEQIRNDVNYMNLNVTVVALGAGFAYGAAGYSHYLIEDIGPMSTFSNFSLFSPSDSQETEIVMRTIVERNGPSYLRLGRGGEQPIIQNLSADEDLHPDILLLFTGSIGIEAIKAKNSLLKLDRKVCLVSVSEISAENLMLVLKNKKSHSIVTLEEHVLRGGFGSLVLESMNFLDDRRPLLRIGIEEYKDTSTGDQDYMRFIHGLDSQSITEKIMKFEDALNAN